MVVNDFLEQVKAELGRQFDEDDGAKEMPVAYTLRSRTHHHIGPEGEGSETLPRGGQVAMIREHRLPRPSRTDSGLHEE